MAQPWRGLSEPVKKMSESDGADMGRGVAMALLLLLLLLLLLPLAVVGVVHSLASFVRAYMWRRRDNENIGAGRVRLDGPCWLRAPRDGSGYWDSSSWLGWARDDIDGGVLCESHG